MGSGGSVQTPKKRPSNEATPIETIKLDTPLDLRHEPSVGKIGDSFPLGDFTASLPLTLAMRGSMTSTTSEGAATIASACEAALLSPATIDAVCSWAQDMGAVCCAELLSGDHFRELTEAAGLKPFEAERLESELRSSAERAPTSSNAMVVNFSSASTLSNQVPGRSSRSNPPRHTHMRVQGASRPRRIVFIRHGESEANVDRKITVWVPDHALHLTKKGREQALDAGVRLRTLIGDDMRRTTFVVSPYIRARETLNGILNAWPEVADPQVLMDVRVREQEFGNFDRPDIQQLHKEKSVFGAFYYRFPDGESPADCYDRGSMFLEHLLHTWDSNVHTCVIVSHGMMILVMIMRILGYNVDEFETFGSLQNCEFCVLERPGHAPSYNTSYTWCQGRDKDPDGLKRVEPRRPPAAAWDGSPEASPMVSHVRKSVVDVINVAHLRVSDANGHHHKVQQPAGSLIEDTILEKDEPKS